MVRIQPPVKHQPRQCKDLDDGHAMVASVICNQFGLEGVTYFFWSKVMEVVLHAKICPQYPYPHKRITNDGKKVITYKLIDILVKFVKTRPWDDEVYNRFSLYEQAFFGRREVIYSQDLIILEGKRGPLPQLVIDLSVKLRVEHLKNFGNQLFTEAMDQAERRVPLFFRDPVHKEANYIVTMATVGTRWSWALWERPDGTLDEYELVDPTYVPPETPKGKEKSTQVPARKRISTATKADNTPPTRKRNRPRTSSESDMDETEDPPLTEILFVDDEDFVVRRPLVHNTSCDGSDYELPENEEYAAAVQDRTDSNDDTEAPKSPAEWKDVNIDLEAAIEYMGLNEPKNTNPTPGARKKLTNITRAARDSILTSQNKSEQSREQSTTKKTEEQYLKEALRIIEEAPHVETIYGSPMGVWSKQYLTWEDESKEVEDICTVLQLTCPKYLAHLLEELDEENSKSKSDTRADKAE
ncbi:hypothetical protein GY45DRAFT_1338838 [Cubamyces sp. BRFM 1775]|nr:hypothetical protein GY45DRAFT_1338838 [Cubamyces sp. BRFM 1775]